VEAETVRYARRLLRPFSPIELAEHLHVTDRQARNVLHELVKMKDLAVVGGNVRFRTYPLNAHLREFGGKVEES
jgi:hypothetical protein